jgi:hypothetical protein
MSGGVKQGSSGGGGGTTTTTVVTFTVENLLYTTILTATCWFAGHYFSILRMPAVVFMFVGTVSALVALHTVSMLLIFSVRHKSVDGAFADSMMADVSQGAAVVCSLLWWAMLLCMFIDVPRITAVVGFPSSASIVSLALVLGFSVVIPFLALVVTYAAVPAGGRNSLVFNGSTVGASSLLFFVIVSFGSGGVMKCVPYESVASSTAFCALVVSYWLLLYVTELLVFFEWNPLRVLWNIMAGLDGQTDDNAMMMQRDNEPTGGGLLDSFGIRYWRIAGCGLNAVIVGSTVAFSKASMYPTVGVALAVVLVAHVPLILKINIDGILLRPLNKEYDVIPAAGDDVYDQGSGMSSSSGGGGGGVGVGVGVGVGGGGGGGVGGGYNKAVPIMMQQQQQQPPRQHLQPFDAFHSGSVATPASFPFNQQQQAANNTNGSNGSNGRVVSMQQQGTRQRHR